MGFLEQYGAWNRQRFEKNIQGIAPDTPGNWFPYSDAGITQVGTRDHISHLLEKTSDKDLGRRAFKLHAAVSAGVLAMSIIGGTYIGNKDDTLIKQSTASVVKATK